MCNNSTSFISSNDTGDISWSPAGETHSIQEWYMTVMTDSLIKFFSTFFFGPWITKKNFWYWRKCHHIFTSFHNDTENSLILVRPFHSYRALEIILKTPYMEGYYLFFSKENSSIILNSQLSQIFNQTDLVLSTSMLTSKTIANFILLPLSHWIFMMR